MSGQSETRTFTANKHERSFCKSEWHVISGSSTVRSVRRSRSPPFFSFKSVQSPACTPNRIVFFNHRRSGFDAYLYGLPHPTVSLQDSQLKHGLT